MERGGVVVHAVDNVYDRVSGDRSALAELSDAFTFEVPGARFTPAFKRGWDGKIRLLKSNGYVYAGLRERVRAKCEELGHECELPQRGLVDRYDALDAWWQRECDEIPSMRGDQTGIHLSAFVSGLGLPEKFAPRDYQLDALKHAVVQRRATLVSPTASGKSLIIYMLARHESAQGGRTLIVVPTTGLVAQMLGDFADYSGVSESGAVGIVGGVDPLGTAAHDVVVSTWQSIMRIEDLRPWVNSFRQIVVDEAHGAKSKSMSTLLEAATEVPRRVGFTGTLDGTLTNMLVIEGLLGPVYRVATTRELMDAGHVAQAEVSVLALKHPEAARRALAHGTYQDEIAYLVGCMPRNDFIAGLARELRGNTMILFSRVETHGVVLEAMIRQLVGDRPVHLLHGGVDGEDRNDVRLMIEEEADAILLSSYGVGSTGVSIKRLHNLVLASPWKSRIIVPQSVGRGLRIGSDKTECKIYDIGDDLSWKGRKNHTLRHLYERAKIYAETELPYRVFPVDLPYKYEEQQEAAE